MRPYVIHGCCLYQSPSAAAIDPIDRFQIEMQKDEGPGGQWQISVKNISKKQKEIFSYTRGNAPMNW
jgi:hypothetical protein